MNLEGMVRSYSAAHQLPALARWYSKPDVPSSLRIILVSELFFSELFSELFFSIGENWEKKGSSQIFKNYQEIIGKNSKNILTNIIVVRRFVIAQAGCRLPSPKQYNLSRRTVAQDATREPHLLTLLCSGRRPSLHRVLLTPAERFGNSFGLQHDVSG